MNLLSQRINLPILGGKEPLAPAQQESVPGHYRQDDTGPRDVVTLYDEPVTDDRDGYHSKHDDRSRRRSLAMEFKQLGGNTLTDRRSHGHNLRAYGSIVGP